MEMLQVGGAKKYHKYAEKNEGDILVENAEFIGASPNKFNPGKNDYEFRDENDNIVVLNSAGHLNYLMENYVSEGDVVTVEYAGKKKIEKGPMAGKESHQFKVLKAKSNQQAESQTLSLDDLE